ncbi:MAG: TetR/AcrR family transcriptional regulator, partial [Gammaproteobacteria bacterium]|nr:TetR/AcrR family transcriptional regulator [Gammaproteobacteria bacterium]
MSEDNLKKSVNWQSKKSSLTRDRIIIAALECIIEFGYESTTMAKITKMAKVSQGS